MPRLLSSFATMAAVRAVVWAAGLLPAALPTAARAADTVDYRQDVKPILQEKCYSCHGALKQEAGLRLETRALMVDEGGVVVPGEPAESYLLERIVAEGGERMPPPDEGAALLPDEIEILRRWIETGAAAPDEAVPVDPGDHWAFRPIVRPAVPEIPVPERAEGPSPAAPLKDAAPAAGSNPIDAFLATHRRQQGLQAQPLAARPLQIRRLYLDLIGLPPTVEQLQDDRPWEQIVDELLSSQRHGERWARHWMDVWRYSDWYGLGKQLRYSQKHLWHWRDWIIESLNADKGYDRMIQEMLAGDELAPHDPDIVRATGFLARNYYLFNRTTWLDSTIEHTGKAFLGLTINCAKCHDHKYDPISQLDYYRFRAIFEPHQVRLDPVPGETDLEQDGLPRVFDNHLDAETYLHLRGDPKNPDKEHAITPGVPAILASFAPPVEPVELPVPAYAPALREHVQQDQLAAAQRRIDSAEQALAQARDDWAAQQAASQVRPPATAAPADPPFVVEDDFDEPRPALWELVGNGWEYQDGALHQRHATREDERIILRPTPPRDFELACRYTTTGGTTYKSVTFRFDHASDDQYANFVYTSAHRPGPKVQVAYTREGQSIYPPAGRAPRPITVGKTYTLRFAVRDTLLNVWLDDELVLAHQLPNRGGERRISLAGFDATVAFDSVAIRKLADDQTLQPATGGQAMPPAGEQAVRRAAAELAVAEADYASLRDRLAADQAKFTQRLEPAAWEPLGRQAARSETLAAQRAAERDRLLAGEDAKKQKAAEAALAKAETRLQAIAAGEPVEYRSVKVTRKALETPADTEADYPATFPSASTGRRLALARWLTSAENPLTARVAVNHVWLRHFGEPLVESVFDFGRRAEPPRHADLLDYLAAEFIASGWSFKHLHRLMVTSRLYRLQSSKAGADPATLAQDPTNQFYWRMNSRRMESQLVRDSLLQLADTLDLQLGGPSVPADGKSRRRSLYFLHSRDDQNLFLTMFDDADLLQCYRRSESIVPQQALALSNSELALEMAEQIARQLEQPAAEAEEMSTFISRAFFTLLARRPEPAEVKACQQFVADLTDAFAAAGVPPAARPTRVRTRLTAALLNHNDFITIR